jgi:phenylacetate-CoA ligase
MLSEIFELARLLRYPHWPADKLADFRRRKLHRLVHHAFQEVPYYRDLMQRNGLRPEDIREFSDLAQIPVTTKAMLRQAGPAALARGARDLETLHTSGSSGTPFEVHCTPRERRTRRLREFRMLLTAGQFGPRDQLVLLGPTLQRPSRLHRALGFYRHAVIPCSLPGAELTARLIAARPDVLWVFPTSLKTVLYYSGKSLAQICRPRTLLTSAQVMDTQFRNRLLAGNPGLEIVDIYGAAEVGRIAAACELRNGLHLEEDALHVELLLEGKPVAPGEEGTVTVTALDQLAMPFIRYEMGDLCRLRLDHCPCGRSSARIHPPAGRNADMVTLPDGRKTSCAALDIALRNETNLVQYRFVQTGLRHIRAELFYSADPGPERLRALLERCSALFDHEIQFSVQQMAAYRTDGPKFKVFISELAGPAPSANASTC